MNILAIDTTTELLGIAVKSRGKIVFTEKKVGYESSRYLVWEIEHLLKKMSLEPAVIDLLAVNTGPGSFTGIRIGLSVVKIWAQVLKREVYPVDSFTILARQSRKILLNQRQNYLGIIIPSIKGEWFRAIYYHQQLIRKPAVVSEKHLLAELKYFGSQILVVGEKTIDQTDINFVHSFPRAKTIIELAEENPQKYVSEENVFPTYFRPSLAEEER